MDRRFVVVTTDHTRRGVFSGELESHDAATGVAVLIEARMAVYWSRETRGVCGLAAIGPQAGSRVGPAVPRIELNGVTSVMDATGDARKAWEAQPWS